jgi:hypothetical protein
MKPKITRGQFSLPSVVDHPYLAPISRPSTLDSFGNRRLILAALRGRLPRFSGVVLDVGCGNKPYRSLLLSPASRASNYIGLDLPANPYGFMTNIAILHSRCGGYSTRADSPMPRLMQPEAVTRF